MRRILAIALCTLPWLCSTASGQSLTAEAWRRPAADADRHGAEKAVPFELLLLEQQSAAIVRLDAQRLIEITREEAARLTGKPVPAAAHAFLVRGLFSGQSGLSATSNPDVIPWAKQQMAVTTDGRSLFLVAIAVGNKDTPAQKAAVVAYIDIVPQEVFITCAAFEGTRTGP